MQGILDFDTVRWLMPEIILLLAAIYLFLMGMTLGNRAWWTTFALGALVIAGVTMFRQQVLIWPIFGNGQTGWAEGPLWIDMLGELIRLLAWMTGMLLTLLAYRGAPQRLAPEYLGALLLAVMGLMLISRANDLVLLFVSLELISIPSYALLFLGRGDRPGMEATAKYFFLSLLSSALLLYGFSFLYGLSGTTQILSAVGGESVAETLGKSESFLLPMGFVLTIAGIGFKLTLVPFHFYAADVYQGTSYANAAFLATIPKLAAVVALLRLLGQPSVTVSPFGWELLVILSMATITLGNVSALWQTDIRRLMAYSSIGHAGYMLAGLAVFLAMGTDGGYGGISGMVFYAAVYVPATLGVFAVGALLSVPGRACESLGDLAGLGRRRPVVSALAAVFLFSLAGIPPLAGFWGKFGILASVVDGGLRWALGQGIDPRGAWLFGLAVVGGINAAIGAAYYLRVIAAMYFVGSETVETPKSTTRPASSLGPLASVIVSAWLVIVLGLMPGPLFRAGFEVERMLVAPAQPGTSGGAIEDVAADRNREQHAAAPLGRSAVPSWQEGVFSK